MTDPTEIRRYYDEYSEWYDAERSAGYYALINDLETDAVRKAAANAAVLELGCGTGIILQRVAELADRATGVDLSPRMVEQARTKGLDVYEASVTALPFADSSFDMVYAFKSLPHVPDIKTALAEVHRVLRPEGVAYLEFYNPLSLKFFANQLRQVFRRRPSVYIRYDSLRDVRLHVAGRFEIVGVRGVRIFAPFRWVYTWPGVRRLFHWLEWRFCDHPASARLGGYLVVELKPLPSS